MSTGEPADPRWFREVLGQYPTGVCVVTATDPVGARVGFVVGSFTSVSLDPPLVAFFPDRKSSTWPRIHSAGRFCVNILSADQEDVCRRFAARTQDKFADLSFREADSGSPIISGVVAWLDCDLESVDDAGDHYVVLGRVRRLEMEKPNLPLLFFQGGYGRFAPLSLAAGDLRGALTEELRQVDLVRREMERVAADFSEVRCTAVALLDGELVVTASAGGLDATSPATLVGQRLAFVPPVGAAFAAWMNGPELDRWLAHLPSEQDRAAQLERLAVVRARGFSVAVRSEAERELESMVARLAADPNAVNRKALHGWIRKLDHEPIDLSPETKASIGVITVPVFGRGGGVAMVLAVYGYPEPTGPAVVEGYIDRLRIAAQRATQLLGGTVPVAG